jgi:hypothetical protein
LRVAGHQLQVVHHDTASAGSGARRKCLAVRVGLRELLLVVLLQPALSLLPLVHPVYSGSQACYEDTEDGCQSTADYGCLSLFFCAGLGWWGRGSFEGGSSGDCGCGDLFRIINLAWRLELKGCAEGSRDLRCVWVVAAALLVVGTAATVCSVVAGLELPCFYWLETIEVVGDCSELVIEHKVDHMLVDLRPGHVC